MFLFKYKCINCKYNISLRVNFYYRLTFLLKLKNVVNTFCEILYAHFFFFFFSSVGFCVLLPSCYGRHPVSQHCISDWFLSLFFLTVLVFFVFCFTVSQYHGRQIIINVSRSKCEYFVFSVFDMEACTFHEMYIVDLMGWMNGWMVCTVCCVKPRLFSSSWERCIYYSSLLNNWSNMSFETEVFLYRSKQL